MLPAMMALASCSSHDVSPVDEPEDPDTPSDVNDGYMVVTFSTKDCTEVFADDGITYQDGEGFENYINPGLVRIVFCTTANLNNYGGVPYAVDYDVLPYMFYKTDDNCYKAYGRLPKSTIEKLGTGNFTIMVAANWPNNDWPDRAANLWSSICYTGESYEYNYGTTENPYFIPSEDTPIPMFGIKQVTSLASIRMTNKMDTYDAGTIYLHRAMAKVVVKSSTGVDIKGASMSAYNRGMSAPTYVYDNDVKEIDQDQENLAAELSPKNCLAASVLSDLPFRKIEGDSENSYVIYIPEWRVLTYKKKVFSVSYTGKPNSIKVTLPTGNATVDFNIILDNDVASKASSGGWEKDAAGHYVNGHDTYLENPFDFIRNHVYVFDITSFDPAFGISYVVEPFSERTSGDITFE
jgi:hypothetical protein